MQQTENDEVIIFHGDHIPPSSSYEKLRKINLNSKEHSIIGEQCPILFEDHKDLKDPVTFLPPTSKGQEEDKNTKGQSHLRIFEHKGLKEFYKRKNPHGNDHVIVIDHGICPYGMPPPNEWLKVDKKELEQFMNPQKKEDKQDIQKQVKNPKASKESTSLVSALNDKCINFHKHLKEMKKNTRPDGTIDLSRQDIQKTIQDYRDLSADIMKHLKEHPKSVQKLANYVDTLSDKKIRTRREKVKDYLDKNKDNTHLLIKDFRNITDIMQEIHFRLSGNVKLGNFSEFYLNHLETGSINTKLFFPNTNDPFKDNPLAAKCLFY
jgi:hypothetical protein